MSTSEVTTMLCAFHSQIFSLTICIADHSWLQNAKKAPNVNLGETVRARLQQFSVMNKLKKRALRVRICCLLERISYPVSTSGKAMLLWLCLLQTFHVLQDQDPLLFYILHVLPEFRF